jgi:hypothetical protein
LFDVFELDKKHNYSIDKLNDNIPVIPVILVNNWRYNNKLFDYIIKRSTKKDYQKTIKKLLLFTVDEDVNGLYEICNYVNGQKIE